MPNKKHKNLYSEYRNSYKFDEKTAEDNYAENLRLRLARRNQEVCHQPWLWGDSSSDETEESETECKSKDERKLGKTYTNKTNLKEESIQVDENSEKTDSDFDGSGSINLNGSHSKILNELKMKAYQRAREMQSNGAENKKPEVPQIDTENAWSTSPQQPSLDAHPQLSRQRPQHPLKGSRVVQKREAKSAPIKPKLSTQEPSKSCKTNTSHEPNKNDNNSSFMFYGNGTTGSGEYNRKQTFNVNSKVDVYQSALRASNQRQYDHQKRANRQTRSNSQFSPLGPRFIGRGNKIGANRNMRSICSSKSISCDEAAKAMAGKRFRNKKTDKRKNEGRDENGDVDDGWHSEYQLQYPIYDNEIYRRCRANIAERGVSARLDTPSTCRI